MSETTVGTRVRRSLGAAALLLACLNTASLLAIGHAQTLVTPPPAEASTAAPLRQAVSEVYGPVPLAKVVDGDTIVVTSDVGPRTVRLIGIDAPETSPLQPGGLEAREALANLLGDGRLLWLELDLGTEDRYGRLLAYVYVPDVEGAWDVSGIRATQVNLAMVDSGWARPMVVPPNATYADLYATAAESARAGEYGLWAMAEAGQAQAGRDGLDGTGQDEAGSSETAPGTAGSMPEPLESEAPPPIALYCALVNPDTHEDIGEWVSVYLSEPLDTRGYYLLDKGSGRTFRLPSGVQPGGELLIGNPSGPTWGNSGDVIYLMRGSEVVDSWAYTKAEASVQGRVLCRTGRQR